MTNRIKVIALLLSLLFVGCTKVEIGEIRGKKYEAAHTDYVPMTTLVGSTMVTNIVPVYTPACYRITLCEYSNADKCQDHCVSPEMYSKVDLYQRLDLRK